MPPHLRVSRKFTTRHSTSYTTPNHMHYVNDTVSYANHTHLVVLYLVSLNVPQEGVEHPSTFLQLRLDILRHLKCFETKYEIKGVER